MNNRDPRRLFTDAQRAQIADRQHHACGVCTEQLPEVFHVHHVIPWADGGATEVNNGVAVCPDCHRRAPILALPDFHPWMWQQEALPIILPMLSAGEFATLNAAPGAGKTKLTAWIYANLRARGDVARMVVFGPTANLRSQWKEECEPFRIFLHQGSASERAGQDGVVLTYSALTDPDGARLQQLIEDAERTKTLFVLDEVHHLARGQRGEAGAWAVNIARLVGTPDRPLHPVLNLSGTLFRSKRSEQISTIRYRQVGDQIETIADYSVTAGRLIGEQQLRHIKVLGFDADMVVSAVDVAGSADAGADTIRAVDIEDVRARSKVLPELLRSPRFIKGIVAETIRRLGHASAALDGAPVKAIIIADSVEHANQVHAEVVDQAGMRHAFLVHGEVSGVEAEIKRFRRSTGQAIMVAVQMVTEGFDVPDICVLTYLRSWRAPLFINQMVGRAMRITKRERELRTFLPATVLVPNDSEIKAAFADVLVGAMNVLIVPPEPCPRCGRELCICPPIPRSKQCPRCGQPWRACICLCGECGRTKLTGCECWQPSPWCEQCMKPQRYCQCGTPTTVDVVSDPELAHVNYDGSDVELHLISSLGPGLEADGLPTVFVDGVVASVQKLMERDPMSFLTHLRGDQ